MSFTGSPTAFNRSPSVQAKLKSLFDEMGGENGTLKVSEIKKAVTGERNALKYDWGASGLVRNKVITALDELTGEEEDRDVTFPELWDSITGNAAKPRIDPLVEAQLYLTRHKLVPLIENMAAAILYEKPDNPRQFLIEKLTALRTTGEEPHHFTDDDLAAMFGMFDVSGREVITAAQTNEAVKVLTGLDGDEGLREEPGRQIRREEFTQHARVALANQLGAVAVAPSR